MDYESVIKQMIADGAIPQDSVEKYCPELAESEDERIRKGIKHFINSIGKGELESMGVIKEDALAWLEKQGEQKPTDMVVSHFKDGDVLISSRNQPFIYNGKYDEDSVGGYCGLVALNNFELGEKDGCRWTINEGIRLATEKEKERLFSAMKRDGYKWDADKKELRKIEQQAAEKLSKEQEYTLNRIVEYLEDNNCPKDWKDLLMGIHDAPYIKPKPAEWGEEDKKKLSRIYSILGQAADEHAFSNTCRLIGDKECVELQDWLKSLIPQPKLEWSEEDERLRDSCIRHIEDELESINNNKYGHSEIISDLKESCRERIDWLEKLKDRYTWKPSEEQMQVLWKYAEQNNSDGYVLHSLYCDLQKLKG